MPRLSKVQPYPENLLTELFGDAGIDLQESIFEQELHRLAQISQFYLRQRYELHQTPSAIAQKTKQTTTTVKTILENALQLLRVELTPYVTPSKKKPCYKIIWHRPLHDCSKCVWRHDAGAGKATCFVQSCGNWEIK